MKLQVRKFSAEKHLQRYCEGLYLWQIISICYENEFHVLYYWIGNQNEV